MTRKQENTSIKYPLPPATKPYKKHCDFQEIEYFTPEIKSIVKCTQCYNERTLLGDIQPPSEECSAYKREQINSD